MSSRFDEYGWLRTRVKRQLETTIDAPLNQERQQGVTVDNTAFTSAIAIAEEAQAAMRALIGLAADTSFESGSGAKIDGLHRNDLAQLLALVNRRIGDAVQRANEERNAQSATNRRSAERRKPVKQERKSTPVVRLLKADQPERGIEASPG